MKKLQNLEQLNTLQMTNTKGGKRTAAVGPVQAAYIMATHPSSARITGTSPEGICIEW